MRGTESYYECKNLKADMPLSVMVWAVSGAGAREMVTLNTSTACQGLCLAMSSCIIC